MLKIQTENGEKVCRRDNCIIIIDNDGNKQKHVIDGMEESPCLKELKRHPNYKTARRQATRIARNRWDRIWWQKQYDASRGKYHDYDLLNLRDYITVRLLDTEESTEEPTP